MIKIPKVKNMTPEQYYRRRQEGVGGTDIGAIVGLHPHKSIMSIYYEKTEPYHGTEESGIAAEIGLELENYMRRKFAQWFKATHNVDIEVLKEDYIYALDGEENNWIRANIDGYFLNPLHDLENTGIEIKTTSAYKDKDWTEEDLPDHHYLQVQWYLMVTGWNRFYVIALIGNNKIRVFEILPNLDVHKSMLESAGTFWFDFVKKGVIPAPTGMEIDTEILAKLFPESVRNKVDLDFLEPDYKKYNELSLQAEKVGRELDFIRQKIMFAMKDNEMAYIKNHKVYWKMQKGGHVSFYRKPKRIFRIY